MLGSGLLRNFVPLLTTLCAQPFSQVSATSLFAHPAQTSAACLGGFCGRTVSKALLKVRHFIIEGYQVGRA